MGATQLNAPHPTCEQLRDFNGGRLGDEEALALGEHLEFCATCRQALRTLADDPFLVRLKGLADTNGIDRAPFPQLTDYRVVRELGRGGMGIVYEAEQVSLGRRVAVKILPARLNDGDALERVRRESRLAARLHHTNIVPVFEVGQEGDVCFYAMQLIPGRSLDGVLAQLRGAGRSTDSTKDLAQPQSPGTDPSASGPAGSTVLPDAPHNLSGPAALPGLGAPEVARIGLQVAEALAYAHARGVLHRDIKPSNLLLDDGGTVWVTDFGLAKADGEDLTVSGAVLGTLRYMAPERFKGECDVRSDVYALGCALYELLALRPAFDAADAAGMMRQVLERVPARLRTLNPSVPRDLETIIHKAMDRERDRRYQSAQELADDLRRFLTGLPTRARPPGPFEHLVRWARRNKGLATALAVIAFLVLTGLVGLGLAAAEFRDQAEVQRKLVGEKETERLRVERANETAGAALCQAETTLTDLYTSHGLIAGERDAPRAMLWFASAARLAARDPDRARANRVRVHTWGHQATLPVRAFGHDGETLRLMAFRPGTGDLLLTVTNSGHCRVWDWAREEPLWWADGKRKVLAACWSPDGRWLALGLPGAVEIREVPSGEVQNVPRNGPVTALVFSPDNRFLAINGGGLRVWDCQKKELMGRDDLRLGTPIRSLTFDPQGKRLAVTVAAKDKQLRMFAVTDGRPGDKPFASIRHDPHGNGTLVPVFVNDGRELITVTGEQELCWWDAETGRPIGRGKLPTQIRYLCELAASPDGRAFAVAGKSLGYGPQIWNATDPATGGKLCEHANMVPALAFSPDGRELLSVSWDRTARLWSVPDGQPVGHPLPHQRMVFNAAYSPDGLHLATGQEYGLVRVWRRPSPPVGSQMSPLPHFAVRLKSSRDGGCVIPGKFGGPFRPAMAARSLGVYDTASGAAVGPAFALGDGCADAAVSANGRMAAAVVSEGRSGALHLWNARTGNRAFDPLRLPGAPAAVAFNADDSQVGVLCDTGDICLFDSQTGERRPPFRLKDWQPGQPEILSLAFAPRTGSTEGAVVVMHSDGSVRVHDETTGALRCDPIRAPQSKCRCGLFRIAPDGQRLAVTWWGPTHAVQVFDLGTGAAVSQPLPHPEAVFDVCFTPDGRRAFTACRDGQARLWDWEAARQVCPPCTHADEVYSVAVTPDGLWGLTACRKGQKSGTAGTVHCWEFTTGKPVAPPVRFDGSVHSIVASPDGTRALAAVEGRGLYSLNLTELFTPADLGPDDLCTLTELAASHQIYKGDVAGLDADQWFALWRAFRQKHPNYGTPVFEGARGGPRQTAAADPSELWVLADRHARKGEWQQAADVLRAVPFPREESWHWRWYCLAALLAETEDLEGYRRHCRAMLECFGDTKDPEIAERVAKTWLLLPGALDPEPGARLIDRALAQDTEPDRAMWFHLVKAMAEYRQGEFTSAIKYLETSRQLNTNKNVYLEALDLLFLAMACKRLGKDTDAVHWLDQAQKHMDQLFPKAGADLRYVWHDYLIAVIVLREAEALFRDLPE